MQTAARTLSLTVRPDLLLRPTVTVADLVPLGAWRSPAGFSGLAGRWKGGSLYLYASAHLAGGNTTRELKATLSYDADLSAAHAGSLPPLAQTRDLGEVSTSSCASGIWNCKGQLWDESTQTLWMSGRSSYASVPSREGVPWLNRVLNLAAAPRPQPPVPCAVGRMQPFGSGLCDVPQWFADAYCSGHTLGVGCGGYESGQDSASGPTLMACSRDGSPLGCTVLLDFAWAEQDGGKRERRPPDYGPLDGISWAVPPAGGAGFWASDRVWAGPVWIDTPAKQGLVYFSRQGVGELNYTNQSYTFSGAKTNPALDVSRLYVYSPADLAAVAQGTKQPYEVRGTYHDLPPLWPGHWPLGAWWDQPNQRLYVQWAFNDYGVSSGRPAAVVVYGVGGG